MRSYYLFFQGAKSANSAAFTETFEYHYDRGNITIFKDFCNAEKTNKNEQKYGSYFVSLPKEECDASAREKK